LIKYLRRRNVQRALSPVHHYNKILLSLVVTIAVCTCHVEYEQRTSSVSVRVPELTCDISNVAMSDRAEFLGLAKKVSPVVKQLVV